MKTLIKVFIPGLGFRFYTPNGDSAPYTGAENLISAEQAGVFVKSYDQAAFNEHVRKTEGTFITVNVVKFPNGKTHIL